MKRHLLFVVGNARVTNEAGTRTWIRTTFRQLLLDANGQPEFYANGKPAWEGQLSGTRLFSEGKEFGVEDIVAGKIVTLPTTPYEIVDRVSGTSNTVKKITCVVFGDENAIEVANNLLKRDGVQTAAITIDNAGNPKENGKPSIKLETKLVEEGQDQE